MGHGKRAKWKVPWTGEAVATDGIKSVSAPVMGM